MKITSEIWKFVPGFEDYYMISNHGNVRSVDRVVIDSIGRPRTIRGKARKQQKNWCGYRQVMLSMDGKARWYRIHQLVAMAFLKKVPSLHEINHKDGNKDNNSPENLEYVTRKYNINHAHATGLMNPFKKAVVKISLNGDPIRMYDSITNALEDLGKACGDIGGCCSGKKKTVGGFQWKYYKSTSDLNAKYSTALPKKFPDRRIVIQQYNKNNELVAVFRKMDDAASIVGVTRQAIQQACSGRCKTVGGYTWKKVSLDDGGQE